MAKKILKRLSRPSDRMVNGKISNPKKVKAYKPASIPHPKPPVAKANAFVKKIASATNSGNFVEADKLNDQFNKFTERTSKPSVKLPRSSEIMAKKPKHPLVPKSIDTGSKNPKSLPKGPAI